MVHPLKVWKPKISPVSISIGYEIQVTALQLTMAYAAIANDGVLMRPRLLKSVQDHTGKVVFDVPTLAVGRIAELKETRILLDFFRKAVADGTGKNADLDWTQVGGKTGTARLLMGGKKRAYSKQNHRASFVGIAPLDDPRIVLTVMIEDPQVSHYGGSVAAPAFSRILETYARVGHALIQPEYATVMVNQKKSENILQKIGPGKVWAEIEKDGTHAATRGLPDVRGRSKRKALLDMGHRKVTFEVTGKVIAQHPAPGTPNVDHVHLICGSR